MLPIACCSGSHGQLSATTGETRHICNWLPPSGGSDSVTTVPGDAGFQSMSTKVCRWPGCTNTSAEESPPSALPPAPDAEMSHTSKAQSSPPEAKTEVEFGIHCRLSTLPEWPCCLMPLLLLPPSPPALASSLSKSAFMYDPSSPPSSALSSPSPCEYDVAQLCLVKPGPRVCSALPVARVSITLTTPSLSPVATNSVASAFQLTQLISLWWSPSTFSAGRSPGCRWSQKISNPSSPTEQHSPTLAGCHATASTVALCPLKRADG
eukprot:COSAG05_NODE_164_length_15364_cov_46.329731_12_plen_265_part_00